jgi:hypothetical protein
VEYFIDSLNHYFIRGWALGPKGIDRIDVIADGRLACEATLNLVRPDIAAARPQYPAPIAERSGFVAHLPETSTVRLHIVPRQESPVTGDELLVPSPPDKAGLIDLICDLAPVLHGSGTFDEEGLRALYSYQRRAKITCSVETGSGASTFLFSHTSHFHTAFTLDGGAGSVANVTKSRLLRAENTQFVLGPSQLTLPKHCFEQRLQFALIDGPHAWPFPDLEYYYIYPHIDSGGFLVLDDIHIPSIGRMLDILKLDTMWRLEEIVGHTAFLVRTDAPTLCPTGDGWYKQGYNRAAAPQPWQS